MRTRAYTNAVAAETIALEIAQIISDLEEEYINQQDLSDLTEQICHSGISCTHPSNCPFYDDCQEDGDCLMTPAS